MDDATFDAILADISAGMATCHAIAKHKACDDTFYKRLHADPANAERYARAKDGGLERWSDDTVRISDEEPQYVETKLGRQVDPAFEQWRKTRIETRKWHLERLRSKRFGSRTVIAGDPDAPLEHRHTSVAIEGKLFPELAAADPSPTVGKPDRS